MSIVKGKTDNTDIPGCLRRLSNSERAWIWNPLANISVVARITGDLSWKDLLRALESARRMHPLLGAKVFFDKDHEAWFSTDGVPNAPLYTVSRESSGQWFREIGRQHLVPFEIETGPMIRFILLYSPEVSELVAFCQHCICDGIALASLLRDILTYYSDPAKEVTAIYPPRYEDYLPEEEASQSLQAKADQISSYNRQWLESPHYFTQADFNEIHKAYWNVMENNIVLMQFQPEETSDLAARCRKEGVTIISATTVAFLAAYEDVCGGFPEDKGIVSIPIDLRRHLPVNVGDVFCPLSGASQFEFRYDRSRSFWENCRDIHAIIYKDVEMLRTAGREMSLFDPTLLDAFTNFAPVSKFIPEAMDKTENLQAFYKDRKNIAHSIFESSLSFIPSTVNTNLGRLDFPETYGNLRLDCMYFLPASSKYIPVILGGIGVSGKMTFTLNYVRQAGEDGHALEEKMIGVRDRALQYMEFPQKESDVLKEPSMRKDRLYEHV